VFRKSGEASSEKKSRKIKKKFDQKASILCPIKPPYNPLLISFSNFRDCDPSSYCKFEVWGDDFFLFVEVLIGQKSLHDSRT